jgi:hypothetical protein
MSQAKFHEGSCIDGINEWVLSHNTDYGQVRDRLEAVRNVVLHGRLEAAATVLRKAYLFAVLSIQTERERHERAFTAHFTGGMDLKEACLETVYGGQKHGWIEDTFERVSFEDLAIAVRAHVNGDRYDTLLDVVTDMVKGVSYRKGSFMLAMSGLYEFMCVDSNVGRYAGIEKRESFDNASDYMDTCHDIARGTGIVMPPFLVQWAIYDFERGEHARHMAYFREVLQW